MLGALKHMNEVRSFTVGHASCSGSVASSRSMDKSFAQLCSALLRASQGLQVSCDTGTSKWLRPPVAPRDARTPKERGTQQFRRCHAEYCT